MTAEHLIARHLRHDSQYRWIVRHNAGEKLPLPSGPTPPEDAWESIRKRHDHGHQPDVGLIIASPRCSSVLPLRNCG